MNKRSHIHKKADSSASNPVRSQLQSRPLIAQAKPQPQKPLTQTQTENQEFQQQKFEATKLELQAKYGTMTPEGQEQLTVLQAKMSGTLQRRLDQASRFGHNFADIPISRNVFSASTAITQKRASQQENRTGLPNDVKEGFENLTGHSMDDVRVHHNSSKPAQLNAFAYTQGTEIYVAPGQKQQVPHEVGHIAQQKEGRVKPTKQVNGMLINDDENLEREADVMATKALQMKGTPMGEASTTLQVKLVNQSAQLATDVVQQNRGAVQQKSQGINSNTTPVQARLILEPGVTPGQTREEIDSFKGLDFLSKHSLIKQIQLSQVNQAVSEVVKDQKDYIYSNDSEGAQQFYKEILKRIQANNQSAVQRGGTGRLFGSQFPSMSNPVMHAQGESSSPNSPQRQSRSTNVVGSMLRNLNPEHPVSEGAQNAITSRIEAVSQVPENPGNINMGRTVELAIFAMNNASDSYQGMRNIVEEKSKEEDKGRNLEEFDQVTKNLATKAAAQIGTGAVISRGLGAIPHPVTRGVSTAFTAAGMLSGYNEVAKMNKFIEKTGAGPQFDKFLEEKNRDFKDQKHKALMESMKEEKDMQSPF
ncbi:MAG: DUF4157 domain-containing protein [Nostoc sp.]|uniref:eCIS core domain-containing protein n=1 Tax=Nostoc sp. TaxID=1180 RepID=UPI002FF765B3